jgi:aspartyl/asparaginyl beta-hydroxylase (cupin superfamily)
MGLFDNIGLFARGLLRMHRIYFATLCELHALILPLSCRLCSWRDAVHSQHPVQYRRSRPRLELPLRLDFLPSA